jgi:uncharacterized phage-associated protein
MARVIDVATYILKKTGSIPAMKLQKLVYYSQAWALVWDERPLFRARIEAWANGPVVPLLYQLHRGNFKVSADMFGGDPLALTPFQQGTVNAVLKHYAHRSSAWLSDLTHAEPPWKEARAATGLKPGERGSVEITAAAMAEYYGGL